LDRKRDALHYLVYRACGAPPIGLETRMNDRLRVAITGSGNTGTDLMIKVMCNSELPASCGTFDRECSRRQLPAGLLTDDELRIPVGPVFIVLAGLLLVLAVRGGSKAKRTREFRR
jgi:hypothetical protein